MPSKPLSAASHAGFHFANLYQCCPRKFYFRWVCRLTTPFVPYSLLFGAAFHEGKEAWYTKKRKDSAIKVAMEALKSARKLFEDQTAYEGARLRMPVLLGGWIEAYGRKDLKKYRILGVELPLEIILPNGYKFTGRLDLLVEEIATGLIYILDTKTSGFSEQLTIDAMANGDQATGYLALARQNGYDAQGVITDVAYWNKNAKYETNIRYSRSEPITRTEDDIEAFCGGVESTFEQMSIAVSRLDQGDPRVLFPRNSYYCMSYNKVCEFAQICRDRVVPGDQPAGFKLDPVVPSAPEFSTLVADSIGVQG